MHLSHRFPFGSPSRWLRSAGLLGMLLLLPLTSAAAAVYYVDNSSGTCSDTGPGTSTSPYCTITAAIAAHKGAGVTIMVRPGTYTEQVTVTANGASGNPFVFQATGPGVIVEGADDFSATSKWTQVSGNVWLASSVTWAPLQVFADGTHLDPSTAAPGTIPARTFEYVAGTGLYVNAGGGNPGTHLAKVGRRLYGFRISGHPWVSVIGFNVTHIEDRAVYVSSGSDNCVVTNNIITQAYRYGVGVSGSNGVLVASNVVTDCQDHGISLTSSSTGCTVQDNESSHNADPLDRRANGIYVNRCTNNLIQRNRLHHNQDSGLNFTSFSNDNICVGNTSWLNGDHGFDHLNSSTGNIHRNDVAYGNYKDGFSIEGGATGTSLYNCIAVDNGLTTNEFDLWVEGTSTSGFVSNYNLFWNSTTQKPVKYMTTLYSSVAAYAAASGHDAQSLQGNPLFVSAAAGDFHILSGSPAIDNAITSVSNWPPLDSDGHARLDDPSTPNTGAGSVLFADRGAYEYVTDQAPAVVAPPTASGPEQTVITFAVTASDPDGQAISSLTANLAALPAGNNAAFTAGAGNTSGTFSWTPTFADGRGAPYNVTFTASNAISGSATTAITVANVDRAPIVSTPASVGGAEQSLITFTVAASDADGNPITSLAADLSALPAGNNASFTVGAGNTSGTFSWTPTFADGRGTAYNVTFTASNALSGSASTAITVANVDRAPSVTAPATASGAEQTLLTLTVSASDPDGDAVSSLTADLSALPAGNNAAFTAGAGNTSGTFTWTPTFADGRGAPYNVTFTASNALSGSATTAITISDADRAPSATAPATASGAEQSLITFTVSASDPDGDAITSLTADTSALPAGNNAAFTAGAGNTSGTFTWTPTFADGRGAPYNVTFTASNALSGSAGTAITVTNVDRAPSVTAPATASGPKQSLITFTVSASDPDGDALTSLTADLSALPAGNNAAFTAGAGNTLGTFTWTPTAADGRGEPYHVTFTAANALSGSATTAISVTDDQSPVVVAPASVSGPEGLAISFTVSASDPDAQAIASLTANTSALPAGNNASFTAGAGNTSGTFTWTPTFADGGGAPYHVTFTASNALSGSATTAITVTDDRAPVVTAPASKSGAEGSPVTFTVSASDPDGHAISSLTADTSALPAGNNAAFTTGAGNTSGTFTWTPTFADGSATPYSVTFTASNTLSGSASTAITVSNTDRAPSVAAPATASGAEQSLITFTVSASDPDGEALTSLTADLSPLPAGNDAVFTAGAGSTSGTFAWTPTFADGRGTPYNVTFTASNALSGSAATAITVTNVDRAPSATAPATASGGEQSLITFTVSASDPDGDAITALTADTSALPAGNNAALTAGTGNTSGTFTWTPTFADGGGAPYNVTFTASNALSGSASTAITVTNVDRAPSVGAPAAVNGTEQVPMTFTVTASDPDGDAVASLTADLSALPAGNNAAFTVGAGNTAGTFTWTPLTGNARPAPYNVTFTALNASSSSVTSAITVLLPNQNPTAALSLSPVTGNAPLAVTADAGASTDPDGFIVSYRFDFGDGTIVGPQAGSTATHNYAAGNWTASVLVTDNGGGTATATASVFAAGVGPGPNLVGNPSFESSTTGWTASSGAIQRVSGGFDGTSSLQMQGPSTGTPKFGVNDSPNWVLAPTTAGTRYRLIAWVRSATATGKAFLRVREYLGSVQQGVTSESPLVTLSPAWQMVAFDYVVLTSGSTLDFQVLDGPVVPNEVFQADNISIRVVTGGAAASLVTGREAPVMPFTAVMAPNPMNPTATLLFTTTRDGSVHVRIFDAAGRRVRDLLEMARVPAGRHSVQFDGLDAAGRRLASGVYFYRVEASEGSIQGRMVVMK